MFLTTPALLNRDIQNKDQTLKREDKKIELNQSIQSLIESVVMPETFTGEKNLDEMDNSLLDFVKGKDQ